MGTKTYNAATDMITFSRASGGTALRRVGSGTELVTNGTFESDTDWSLASTWSVGSGTLNYAGSGNSTASQTNVFEVGKMYLVSSEMVSGAGAVQIYSGTGGNTTGHDVLYFDSVGTYSRFILATATSLIIRRTGGTSFSIDNVSVKEVIFDRATDPLVLFNHADNIPRIEYDAAGAVKGLLIEEARTNLTVYSEDFTNAAWAKTGIATLALDVIGPDGVTNSAVTLVDSAAGGAGQVRISETITTVVSTVYTHSVFAKADGLTTLQLATGTNDVETSSSPAVNFNLSDGTFTEIAPSGLNAATMEDVGGGWFRCSVTYAAGVTSFATQTVVVQNESSLRIPSVDRDGTSSILIYGSQFEVGSFATSYIPTSGASATRAADVASIPTSAFGYNSGAGSIYVNGTFLTGDTIVTLGSTTIAADADGVKDYTVTYSADPSATGLVLNQGTYSDVKYYPRILSSAQLSELTT